MSELGIDVYEGDGNIDWSALKSAGYTFAFVKATEGSTEQDGSFAAHWHDMKQHGIVRRAYHFFHYGTSPAEQQARNFLDMLRRLESGDLPPVLDIEDASRHGADGNEMKASEQVWLDIVEQELHKQTGKVIKPIIYTAPYFWKDLGDPDLSDYPVWIAHYDTDTPIVPPSWGGTWLCHQYRGDISVSGVENKADLNRWISIQLGNTGKLVEDIQTRMSWIGHTPGPVDGSFGQKTKLSVMAFQKSKGLPQDGIVNLKTYLAMIWA